jgi:hypothetical protein
VLAEFAQGEMIPRGAPRKKFCMTCWRLRRAEPTSEVGEEVNGVVAAMPRCHSMKFCQVSEAFDSQRQEASESKATSQCHSISVSEPARQRRAADKKSGDSTKLVCSVRQGIILLPDMMRGWFR